MVDIVDSLKKTMTAGIGLALKTKDEVEELARDLTQKWNLPEADGKTFIADLQRRYDDAQTMLEERVERIVKDLMKRADLVTGEELRALKKEIRELKKAISDTADGSDS